MDTAYKVVDDAGGSLYAQPPFRREYRRGEWTFARDCSGLLVFPDLRDALTFREGQYTKRNCSIWKCQCSGPVPLPSERLQVGCWTDLWTHGDLRTLWKNGSIAGWFQSFWAPGTKAYRRVKLMEECHD